MLYANDFLNSYVFGLGTFIFLFIAFLTEYGLVSEITEILLKVALNTITLIPNTLSPMFVFNCPNFDL
jgi:hypothetical protein